MARETSLAFRNDLGFEAGLAVAWNVYRPSAELTFKSLPGFAATRVAA